MTKAELTAKLEVKINLNKKQAETVVNSIIKSINDALATGDKVESKPVEAKVESKPVEETTSDDTKAKEVVKESKD